MIDREVAGLFSLRTVAAARGRGHASAVVQRLGAWAQGMGATLLFQQIEEANAPALGLARQLGFERRYGYWYRELPPQAA